VGFGGCRVTNYEWFLLTYPELKNTVLTTPEVFRAYEDTVALVREDGNKCSDCIDVKLNGCNGSRLVIDTEASILYGRIIIGTTKCSKVSEQILRQNYLTSSGFSEVITGKMAEVLSGYTSFDEWLSSLNSIGVTREVLSTGGSIHFSSYRQVNQNIQFGNKSDVVESTPRRGVDVQMGHTSNTVSVEDQVSKSGLLDKGQASPPIVIRENQMVTTSSNPVVFSHWLGVYLLSLGFFPGYHDVMDYSVGWNDDSVALLTTFIDEVEHMILVNYGAWQPSVKGKVLMASLVNFIASEGILWLVLAQHPSKLMVVDPICNPLMEYLAEKPVFEAVRDNG
jgi:hypothetical protein